MRKLEVLDISNTDIDSGLEYLPESIEYFWCSTEERPQAACQTLQKQLAPYKAKPGSHYNYQAWKKANPDLIIARWKKEAEEAEEEIVSRKRKITELEEELQMEREEAAKALDKAKEWRERQLQEITTQKDKEIEQLRTENTRLQQLVNQQPQILHNPPKTN